MVFSPKFRAPVLTGPVAVQCRKHILETCRQLDVDVVDIAVMPDHVHLFIRYPPRLSVSTIAQRVKGASSRKLRKQFPELKRRCKRGLWAPSCYHGAVGRGYDVVRAYIQDQDHHR